MAEGSQGGLDNIDALKQGQATLQGRLDALYLEVKAQKESVKQALDNALERIRHTETIVWFGLIILIFMFGGILAQVWLEREASYEALLDKVDTLQAQMGTSTNQ